MRSNVTDRPDLSSATGASGLTPPPDSSPLQRRALVSRRTLVGAGAAALLVGCPSKALPPQPPMIDHAPHPGPPEEEHLAPHPGPGPEPGEPTPSDKQPVEAVPPQTQPEPEPVPESRRETPSDTNPSSAVGPAPDKPLVPGMQGTPPGAKPVFGTAEPKPL